MKEEFYCEECDLIYFAEILGVWGFSYCPHCKQRINNKNEEYRVLKKDVFAVNLIELNGN